MREGDEERVAVHEAGHAVAYLVMGRPIDRAIVTRTEHQVDPVIGTRIDMTDEAVAMAAGWAAEERRFRLAGMAADQLDTEWLNGGHHDDRAMLEALASKVDAVNVSEAESRAEQLVGEHWELILALSAKLLEASTVDQDQLEALGALHGVDFGQGFRWLPSEPG